MLSFKASTCLAPGDCGVLIPVLARSSCGPGQVTFEKEGIHQVPRGPAPSAIGCKTILSSNWSRGSWRGLWVMLSQLRAPTRGASCWGGLVFPPHTALWVSGEGYKPSKSFQGLCSLTLEPSWRASIQRKYRCVFSPSRFGFKAVGHQLFLPSGFTSMFWAGLADPFSDAQRYSLVCHLLSQTDEIFFLGL